MTPQEFKAWFDGFTEALDGTPNKAQWTRIRARVAEIDGKPLTERVYVDRYWSSYPQPRSYYPWTYLGGTTASMATGAVPGKPIQQYQAAVANMHAAEINSNFDSLSAMNTLGRDEAATIGVS